MKIISVPVNLEAMNRLDYDICEESDLIEINLDNEDFRVLWETGVLDVLNKKLGIMIDDFEDESIGTEQIPLAKAIVAKFAELIPNVKVLKDLKYLVDVAEEKKTGVFFFF